MEKQRSFLMIVMLLTTGHASLAMEASAPGDNRTLHVVHMYSAQVSGILYLAGRETIEFAVQLLNNRADILPGYRIQLHNMDVEQWQVGEAMKSFIDAVSQDPIKIGMIGPIFSAQTEVLAQTAGFFHLVEIGYRQAAPSLSDVDIYPYFLRTIENGALFNYAISKIIEHFQWKFVASIAYDSDFVLWSREHLVNLLLERNVTIVESASYSHKTLPHTRELKSSNARILVSHMYHRPNVDRRRLLCQIYKEGVFGRKYQWLHWTHEFGVVSELGVQDTVDDGCSLDQIHQVLEGMFTFKAKKMNQTDYRTIIGSHGRTTEELVAEYRTFLNSSEEYTGDADHVELNYHAFDAIWSLALGLNKSIVDYRRIGADLKSFNYDRKDMADILFENIRTLQYFGALGPMSFDEHGDFVVVLEIFQYRRGELDLVGYYSPFTDTIQWLVSEAALFPQLNGRPPYDRDIIRIWNKDQSRGLFYTTFTLAALGILYAVTTFCYTWTYRHTKYIKMSSPRINGVICFGCILTYVAVILWGVGLSDKVVAKAVCKLRLWFLVAGFTCAFGSMFSKTWRVHKIISTKTLERKGVKDSQLLLFVVCLFAVDAVMLFVWEIVDPLEQEQLLLDIEEDEDDDGIIYQPAIYKCACEYGGYWSAVLYSIKGLLLIFGIFFAWETRNVQIEGLNDSKLIGVCVYSVMVSSVVAVPLVNILSEEQYNIIYGITVISMLLCCTLIITLVFATKAHNLLRHGEKVDELVVTRFQSSTQNAATIDHKPKLAVGSPSQSTLATTLQPPVTAMSGKANRVSPGLDQSSNHI